MNWFTRRAAACVLGVGSISSIACATPLGLNTDPAGAMWDRGDANTGFAVFDSFPSFTYTGDTPDSIGGLTSPTLSQSNTLTGNGATDQGAGVYDNVATQTAGTDVYFSGGRGGSFSFAASTSFNIEGLFLQIKLSTLSSATISPLLNGTIAPDSISSITGSGDSHDNGNYTLKTFFWGDSLVSQSITNPTITFTDPNNRAIDAITVDAGSVPEPASLGLFSVAGLLMMRRTRRSSAKV